MEDWVNTALKRWPNVPALYGWLSLDRRGRWRIRGEIISRPQIIDTINRNYAADARGQWFFQNGPQRGYMALEYTPMVLHVDAGGRLFTHTGLDVEAPRAVYLDDEGAVLVDSAVGAGVLGDDSLNWVLARMTGERGDLPDAELEQGIIEALARPSGASTGLYLSLAGRRLPLQRLDRAAAPAALGFVQLPQTDDNPCKP